MDNFLFSFIVVVLMVTRILHRPSGTIINPVLLLKYQYTAVIRLKDTTMDTMPIVKQI